MSAGLEEIHSSGARAKSTRRSWPRAEKRRIVEAAFGPGASVADVARLHGLNANQVFNWRRRMVARSAAAAKVTPPVEFVAAEAAPAASVAGFVPVGMFVQTDDRHAPAALATVAPPTTGRAATDARMGMIEIHLTCGTLLRVDAFVNERALRRVLSVLKAMR